MQDSSLLPSFLGPPSSWRPSWWRSIPVAEQELCQEGGTPLSIV